MSPYAANLFISVLICDAERWGGRGEALLFGFAEEVRYRVTSVRMVVVLVWVLVLGRGVLGVDEVEGEGEGGEREGERRGWVEMWVRTSWLVRVADWVWRICERDGRLVRSAEWEGKAIRGEGRPSFWGVGLVDCG